MQYTAAEEIADRIVSSHKDKEGTTADDWRKTNGLTNSEVAVGKK